MFNINDLQPEIEEVRNLLASPEEAISVDGVTHMIWKMNDNSDFEFEHGKLNGMMHSLYHAGKMDGHEVMGLRNERDYAEQYLALLRVQKKLGRDSKNNPVEAEEQGLAIGASRMDLLRIYARQGVSEAEAKRILEKFEDTVKHHIDMLIPETVIATITPSRSKEYRERGDTVFEGKHSITVFNNYKTVG